VRSTVVALSEGSIGRLGGARVLLNLFQKVQEWLAALVPKAETRPWALADRPAVQ
jgi:hypothetical protein